MSDNYFFYKVNHDYGLAPNPFHGYCTLAVCKSQIRKSARLNIGDWIIGISGKKIGATNKLIFAMKLEEKITFDDYWNDKRFVNKKPIVNGSLMQMYGDNFYHTENGEWIQENSAHSSSNGNINDEYITNNNHLKRDTGGKFVLISQHFYYFGDNAPEIPESSKGKFKKLINYTYSMPDEIKRDFASLLKKCSTGIHGDPASWKDSLDNQDIKLWKQQLQWECDIFK